MNRNKLRLAQSMEKLVAQKPLTKLTIGEICDDAMLSRATFYHHFKDKYDLVNWIFDCLFDRTFINSDDHTSWEERVVAFLGALKENRHFYTQAYRYNGQNSLEHHHYTRVYDTYHSFFIQNKGSDMTLEEEYCLEVYCRGAVFVTRQWALDGMERSLDWMTTMFRRAMTDEICDKICK